jgi:hypothetical protein
MSNSNYLKLLSDFKNNKQIIRTLNLCYPSLMKNHKLFKFFAHLSISIKDWFIYGLGNAVIFSVIFFVYIILIGTYNLTYNFYNQPGSLAYIFEWINLIFAIILASAFITIFIRFLVLKIAQVRYLLSYFSPYTPENVDTV